MKILIVTIFPPEIGGPATQAAHLCEALIEEGHTLIVVSFDRNEESVQFKGGLKVYRMRFESEKEAVTLRKARRYVRFIQRFRTIVKRETPDVVHCNSMGFYSLLVGLVCRAGRVPSVIKFASDLAWELVNRRDVVVDSIEEAHRYNMTARLAVLLERMTLRLFHLVWATSRYRKDTLVRLLRVDERRIQVVPNYIRLPSDRSSADRSKRTTIGLVTGGRFVPHKRLDECLLGFSRLQDHDVVLNIYGGGSDRQERVLRGLIRDLHLEDRVVQHGRLVYGDLLDLLRNSDIYVSTSIEEGFPISLIEAMAMGLPIVAVSRGAVPELVPNGEAGLLYEPGDVEGMVSAMQTLIERADLRKQMGRFGAEHARSFDLRVGVEKYATMYHRAIHLAGK